MKLYVIKTTYTNARIKKANNRDYWTLKGGHIIDAERMAASNIPASDCYSRLCDAKRALAARRLVDSYENTLGCYAISSEIISIER